MVNDRREGWSIVFVLVLMMCANTIVNGLTWLLPW